MSKKPSVMPVSMHIATVITPILSSFYHNLARVNHLVSVYRGQYGKGSGRKRVDHADILRAAIVFLHAAFEDYLRSVARIFLPSAKQSVLDAIPLVGTPGGRRPEKFQLGALAAHRSKTVQNLIDESVEAHLSHTTYSDIDAVVWQLEALSISLFADLRATFPALEKMIKRRHHIVHRADSSNERGRGKQRALAISARQVDLWIAAVRNFSMYVSATIIDREFESFTGVSPHELEALVRKIKDLKTLSEQQAGRRGNNEAETPPPS